MFGKKKIDLEATFGTEIWGRLVEKFTVEGATKFATAVIEEMRRGLGPGVSVRENAAFTAAQVMKVSELPEGNLSGLTDRLAKLLD